MKKTKHVSTVSQPDRLVSTRGLYRTLDRRKAVAGADAVQLVARRIRCADDDAVEDFPASEYQRMYES